MRYYYNRSSPIVAIIAFDEDEYVFNPQDEEGIYEFLSDRIGDRLYELSGVPVCIEASSWCAMANIGSIFEDEDFEIYIDDLS